MQDTNHALKCGSDQRSQYLLRDRDLVPGVASQLMNVVYLQELTCVVFGVQCM